MSGSTVYAVVVVPALLLVVPPSNYYFIKHEWGINLSSATHHCCFIGQQKTHHDPGGGWGGALGPSQRAHIRVTADAHYYQLQTMVVLIFKTPPGVPGNSVDGCRRRQPTEKSFNQSRQNEARK